MPLDYLVSALVTLVVVVDPVGLAPTFLAVTHGLPAELRRRIAVRACIIAGAILAGTALVGDWLLATLGITLPAFRIAGGLLLSALLGVIVIAMALCLGVFLLANRIDRLLGVTGNVVASRLLGVLLAALAVQFVIDGVRAVLVPGISGQ